MLRRTRNDLDILVELVPVLVVTRFPDPLVEQVDPAHFIFRVEGEPGGLVIEPGERPWRELKGQATREGRCRRGRPAGDVGERTPVRGEAGRGRTRGADLEEVEHSELERRKAGSFAALRFQAGSPLDGLGFRGPRIRRIGRRLLGHALVAQGDPHGKGSERIQGLE